MDGKSRLFGILGTLQQLTFPQPFHAVAGIYHSFMVVALVVLPNTGPELPPNHSYVRHTPPIFRGEPACIKLFYLWPTSHPPGATQC